MSRIKKILTILLCSMLVIIPGIVVIADSYQDFIIDGEDATIENIHQYNLEFDWDNWSWDSNSYEGSDGDQYTFHMVRVNQMHEQLKNVFCVQQGQDMGSCAYRVNVIAEIRGNEVKIKRIDTGESETIITDGDISNKIAAAITSEELINFYDVKNDGKWNIMGKQIAITKYWNEWVRAVLAELPDTWDGVIEEGAGNESTTDPNEIASTYKDSWPKVKEVMDELINSGKTYGAKIYYASDISTWHTGGYQNLVVVEPIEIEEQINITVEKKWDDNDNQDGKRPSSIEVKLLADGADTGKRLTLNASTVASENWKGTFTGLEKYKDGNEIEYTVDEVNDVSGYTKSITGNSVDGFTITNTHTPEKIEIKIQKSWNDDSNRDGIRPTSIKVRIKKGTTVVQDNIVLNKDNSWTYTTGELDKYENGTAINYTVEEIDVPNGYSCETVKGAEVSKIVTYTVTNTHSPTKIDISVEKNWDDDSNRDGIRPTSVTIRLYADEVDTGKTLILNSSNSWKSSFTGLLKYKEGKEGEAISYTISENSITGYTTTITGNSTSGFVVTNKHIPEKINISVEKKWDDDNNRDGIRPTSVTIRLYEDGADTGKTLTLNSSNSWKASFSNLFKNKAGKAITYTIKEDSITGYTSVITGNSTNGFVVTNTHIPELIEVPVQKIWDDDSNRDGIRPSSVTVELYADNNLMTTATINGSNTENTWDYTFESTDSIKLYKYRHEGVLINYTVEEIKIGDLSVDSIEHGYEEPKYSKENGVLKITNTHITEKVKVKVQKEWNDDSDLDVYRPESITLKLLANGESAKDANGRDVSQVIINEPGSFSNLWEKEVTNLFRYCEQGEEIEYTIVEETVPSKYSAEVIEIEAIEENDMKVYTLKVKNTHEPSYEGYIEITGKVWKDRSDGKANTINGILDEDESGVEGIKVILKDANGKQFDATSTSTTDKNGNYTIKVNYDNSNKAYKLYKDINTVNSKLKTAYVEFEYDGMAYTTVDTLTAEEINAYNETVLEYNKKSANFVYGGLESIAVDQITIDQINSYNEQRAEHNKSNPDKEAKKLITKADVSKSIENETERNEFDQARNKVEASTLHPDKWTDKAITAITKDVISFENYADINNKTSTEVIKYCNGDGTYIRTNPEGAWNAIIKESLTKYKEHPDNCSGAGDKTRTFDVDVKVIQNINLGLFEREQPDIAIISDLSKVEVEINSQAYTYLYNVMTTVTEEKAKQAYEEAYEYAIANGMTEEQAKSYAKQKELTVKFQKEKTYEYRRPMNPADIAFIQDEINKDKMSVYVTYEVKVLNSKKTLPIIVHQITNYFDSRYTLQSTGWDTSSGSQYNTATNTSDLNIRVAPESESEVITLKYKVDITAIQGLLKEEATLNNAVEIEAYSTVYGTGTLYAEQRTGGRTNQPYAGYDYDSHPGNSNIQLKTGSDGIERLYSTDENGNIIAIEDMEDDTYIAPSFVLCLDEERKLSGNVWEDTDTGTETGPNNLRVGNGTKDPDEQYVGNVKVELYQVDDEGNVSDAPANLYKITGEGEDAIIETKPAIAYTSNEEGEKGKYSFGSEDGYSVLTDTYLMKFTYGEGVPTDTGTISSAINNVNVNARNYKSTIISDDSENEIYKIFKGTSTNLEWHLNIPKGYSIALDDVEKRVGYTDLQYGNFDEALYMEAYSKPFKMQVEYDPSGNKEAQVGVDGKTVFGNELSVFDFGIIERAREDIFVEKTIEYIKVTLANGQVLTEGSPRTGTLNYAKANGFTQVINSGDLAKVALQKQMIIEMDANLIQGAQLDITYEIKVTNNSEKEYDYYIGDKNAEYDPTKLRTEYYYYGTNNENSPVITTSVNYLACYVDSDLSYEWDDINDWQKVSAEDLKDKKFISDATYEELKQGKYNAYVTTKYKELQQGSSVTDYAYARRLLANSDENVYENHTEILQIDSKVARTIKQTGVIKEYKMGNYVPGTDGRKNYTDVNDKLVFVPEGFEEAGLHEQDDDRIAIFIGPPTGITNYITPHIIIGLVGLIVIAIGIVIIKKKII